MATSPTDVRSYEEAVASTLGGPRALQHRRRRLRQAPARQARRWSTSASTAPRARCAGASCRTSPTRPRTCCATRGVERGDRVAVVLPPTPETAAIFFGTWKLGAMLLSMSVLYGDDGHPPPAAATPSRACWSPTRPTPPRFDGDGAVPAARPRRRAARRRADRARRDRHRGRRPGAALLHLGHHRAGEGHRPRPSLPARPRGVRLLPRGARRRALPRHGRVGVGGGHRAAARPVAPGRGAVRAAAQGRLRPRTSSSTSSSRHEVTNVFTTPTAMRSMMAIADAGTRYPQRFRIVCCAGEPLNPEAIRWFREQYGLTVLDYYGLTGVLPAVRELPVHGGARGLDGPADARLGRADPRRGRAAGGAGRARRDLPARALQPALPARLLAQRGGGAGDLRRRLVPHQGRRDAGRGRLRLVRGPRRRRDHRRRATGSARSRSSRRASSIRRSPRRRRSPRPTSGAATSSRRSSSSPRATSRATSSPRRSRRSSATGCRAYAYPRRIEFVDRPAQDADRQDPPDRAARAGGRAAAAAAPLLVDDEVRPRLQRHDAGGLHESGVLGVEELEAVVEAPRSARCSARYLRLLLARSPKPSTLNDSRQARPARRPRRCRGPCRR